MVNTEFNREKKELKKQVSSVSENSDLLLKDIEYAKSEKDKLGLEIQNLKGDLGQLQNFKENANEYHNELEIKLKEASVEVEQAKETESGLQKEMEDKDKEIYSLNTDKIQLENDKDTQSKQVQIQLKDTENERVALRK